MDARLVVGGIVVGAALVRWLTGRNRSPDHADKVGNALQALRSRPRAAIALAADGPVLIEGRVSAEHATLVAPFSRRPCVFYELLVEDLAPEVPRNRAPEGKLLHMREAQAFALGDDSGTAAVAFDDVNEVSFVVPADLTLQGRSLRDRAGASDVLASLAIERPIKLLCVTEAIIAPGDTVAVAGAGRREVVPSAQATSYRSPPFRLVVRADANALLSVVKKGR